MIVTTRTSNQVMFEFPNISVMDFIEPKHAATDIFAVNEAIWVLCKHAVVSVTITHRLGEKSAELVPFSADLF